MDTLSWEQTKPLARNGLKKLLELAAWPCVSLYMPVQQSSYEARGNADRLRTLIDAAEHRLARRGLKREAVALLNPAYRLVTDDHFWQHRSGGLVIFLSAQIAQYYDLAAAPLEQVALGRSFNIRPLLPLLGGEQEYLILALSRVSVRLVRVRNGVSQEVDLPASLLRGLDAALQHYEIRPQQQAPSITTCWSPAWPETAVATPADAQTGAILRVLRQIDSSLHEFLRGERAPLVLAGADHLLRLYRAANSYTHLVAESLAGDPAATSAAELGRLAWPLVQSQLRRAELQAVQRYHEQDGPLMTSTDLAAVLPAALAGQVETLFLARDAEIWGSFNPTTRRVTVHHTPLAGDEDLGNLAACYSIADSGDVYALDAAEMPAHALLAAILRH